MVFWVIFWVPHFVCCTTYYEICVILNLIVFFHNAPFGYLMMSYYEHLNACDMLHILVIVGVECMHTTNICSHCATIHKFCWWGVVKWILTPKTHPTRGLVLGKMLVFKVSHLVTLWTWRFKNYIAIGLEYALGKVIQR